MRRLIWIYVVCKSLLLSPVAVKELMQTKEVNNVVILYVFVQTKHKLNY